MKKMTSEIVQNPDTVYTVNFFPFVCRRCYKILEDKPQHVILFFSEFEAKSVSVKVSTIKQTEQNGLLLGGLGFLLQKELLEYSRNLQVPKVLETAVAAVCEPSNLVITPHTDSSLKSCWPQNDQNITDLISQALLLTQSTQTLT